MLTSLQLFASFTQLGNQPWHSLLLASPARLCPSMAGGSLLCSWVGVGGRIMGAAYALAHKEGHNFALYKKPLRGVFGNFFENWLGMFYGIIPYSFTTSHVSIHHRLDGGLGDTFYQWDLNRASLSDFCLYVIASCSI